MGADWIRDGKRRDEMEGQIFERSCLQMSTVIVSSKRKKKEKEAEREQQSDKASFHFLPSLPQLLSSRSLSFFPLTIAHLRSSKSFRTTNQLSPSSTWLEDDI